MRKIHLTTGAVCAMIGLFLGVIGATMNYGQESGALQQKVNMQEETLKDLKIIIADIHKFQLQMLQDTGDIKKDIAVLRVMIENIMNKYDSIPIS